MIENPFTTSPYIFAPGAMAFNGNMWLATSVYNGGSSNPNYNSGEYILTYSQDGVRWYQATNGLPITINGGIENRFIAWGNSTWVVIIQAVAYASPDGINWTASTWPYTGPIKFINGLFIMAYQTTFYSSYDGLSWITYSDTGSGGGSISIIDFTFDGKLWVAGMGGSTSNYIRTSLDGVKWSIASSADAFITPTPYGGVVRVVYTNGNIWLGGLDNDSNLAILYSYDGYVWYATNGASVGVNTCSSITYNGIYFFATCYTGTAFAPNSNFRNMYSADGITWYQLTALNTLIPYECRITARTPLPVLNVGLTVNPLSTRQMTENFMMLGGYNGNGSGYTDNTLIYSYDGSTWYPTQNNQFDAQVVACVWTGNLWVFAGGNYPQCVLAYSSDGINIKRSDSGQGYFGGGNGTYCLATNGQLTLAGANTTYPILSTYDGVTWYPNYGGSAVLGGTCFGLAWGNMWLASTTGKIIYSKDGISWANTNATTNGVGTAYSMVYNGSMWVAGGTTPSIMYSYDGINWTISTSADNILTDQCSAVAWNGYMWVAGGRIDEETGAIVMYSYDGINWTAGTGLSKSGTTSYLYGLSWNGKLWIAAVQSSAKTVYSSIDGINWAVQPSASSNYHVAAIAPAVRKLTLFPRATQSLGGTGQSSAGGSLDVNFNTTVTLPIVTATVSGASPALITVNNVGPTGFSAATYNLSGAQTGPVNFNWTAIP